MTEPIKLGREKMSIFKDKVMQLLPDGGNLNACLTCGACSSGCPATGMEGMDPRKFLRMASMGLDEQILSSNWVWMCTLCWRCLYVCPMKIDIPQLVYHARKSWPRDSRPKGIRGSCDMALKHDTCSAMGASEDDFRWSAEVVRRHGLEGRAALLFSPVSGGVEPRALAGWLLASGLKARLSLQLHKLVWGPDARGV
jgi:ferredoxin